MLPLFYIWIIAGLPRLLSSSSDSLKIAESLLRQLAANAFHRALRLNPFFPKPSFFSCCFFSFPLYSLPRASDRLEPAYFTGCWTTGSAFIVLCRQDRCLIVSAEPAFGSIVSMVPPPLPSRSSQSQSFEANCQIRRPTHWMARLWRPSLMKTIH